MKGSSAVDQMVTSVQRGEELSYFVSLNGYWIEGYPYTADGLTVDQASASHIERSEDGFECDCWFPPDMIQPKTLRDKEIVERKSPDGGGVRLVKVRVTVRLEDVSGITAMGPSGESAQLFFDMAVLKRKLAFVQRTQRFFKHRDERA
jgi:hypothetical protein